VFTFAAIGAFSTPVLSDTQSSNTTIANNTRFLLFDMQPFGMYNVSRSGVALPQATATGAGAVSFLELVDIGDQIIVSLFAIDQQPPIPPQQVQARETSPGCVTVSWAANPEPDLAGYIVYWGSQSVSQGQTLTYANSANVANVLSHEICGFSPGTQYFAVRAYNTSDESSGYSSERAVTIAGADTQAPAIVSMNPVNGAQNVPIDTKVSFRLQDSQSGVDTNSVAITINGGAPTSRQFSGTPANYLVVCDVAGGFSAQTTVNVTVQVSDLASPANSSGAAWSFTTGNQGDAAPPAFCCANPGDGATGVSPTATISIGISDAESGVDLSRINFLVNGQFVLYDVTGDAQDAVVTFLNPQGFPANSVVDVSVTACDLSSSVNCATLNLSFQVGGTSAAVTDAGAVFPDGYWVGDPTRPLEVRNIPVGWTVRIFDTSGHEVRAFTNNITGGHTWAWDFTNDGGHTVARALYLVRVFNEGGGLQRTGRFVVQLDR
jgi:hypothetical protein